MGSANPGRENTWSNKPNSMGLSTKVLADNTRNRFCASCFFQEKLWVKSIPKWRKEESFQLHLLVFASDVFLLQTWTPGITIRVKGDINIFDNIQWCWIRRRLIPAFISIIFEMTWTALSIVRIAKNRTINVFATSGIDETRCLLN